MKKKARFWPIFCFFFFFFCNFLDRISSFEDVQKKFCKINKNKNKKKDNDLGICVVTVCQTFQI